LLACWVVSILNRASSEFYTGKLPDYFRLLSYLAFLSFSVEQFFYYLLAFLSNG